MVKKPVILIILDGWGLAPDSPGNAVSLAKIPNFSSYWNSFPHTKLQASGEAVGLPKGEKGNSETGHLNIGAGRIVYQDLPRINMAIADGSFFKFPAFLEAAKHCRENNSNLHLLGLLGQGGVHSSIEHLFALLRFAKEQGLTDVYLHLFTDGRDSPQNAAPLYIKQVKDKIAELGVGKIATIIGRYYAMDRDNRWERTEVAYRALVNNQGKTVTDFNQAINEAYQNKETDEFLKPLIDGETPRIQSNDSVIFFNFRIDRPRQLTKAFVLPEFEKAIEQDHAFDPYAEKYTKNEGQVKTPSTVFSRGPKIANLFFVTMTEYEKNLPVKIALMPTILSLTLGSILSEKGLRQLRITETEKERFISYYFNGQNENPYPLEERITIPSPKVATYDLKPEMSTLEITETVLQKLKNGYDFILLNFANPDMVGHTGNLQAGIKACEAVDLCLGKIVNTVKTLGGTAVITADHGNVEEMINLETGEIDTEHSKNPVPFILVGTDYYNNPRMLPTGILADVAPTILKLMEVNIPGEISGRPLI